MKGWVYIISNKAMPGLVKIGFSSKDPEYRAKELDSTASPHPHIVEFAILVDDPRQFEQSIHSKLNGSHEGKEWFRCSVDSAKLVIINSQSNPIITHGDRKHIKPRSNTLISSQFARGQQPKTTGGVHQTSTVASSPTLVDQAECDVCGKKYKGMTPFVRNDKTIWPCQECARVLSMKKY